MAEAAQRLRLGEIASEADFERAVVRVAHVYGWCGYHVRRSEEISMGVHRFRLDGHDDAFGKLDWEFWNPRRGRYLQRELKSPDGILTRHQKRTLADLAACGVDVGVWRPADWEEIVRTFAGQ